MLLIPGIIEGIMPIMPDIIPGIMGMAIMLGIPVVPLIMPPIIRSEVMLVALFITFS